MEGFVTYKLPRKPKIKLFIPLPYCRKAAREREPVVPLELHISDPAKILRLCESLVDRSTSALEAKINTYLAKEAGASVVFLVNLLPLSEEAVVKVIGDQTLPDPIKKRVSGDLLKKLDRKDENGGAYEESDELQEPLCELINSVIDEIEGDKSIFEVLTVPVGSCRTKSEKPVNQFTVPILACIVNSTKEKFQITQLVEETFRYCLTVLLNTLTAEEESRVKHQCQTLLVVARRLFSHLGDLNDLLQEIMVEAKALTSAERCSLFLLDPDHMHLVAKVFDGAKANDESGQVRIAKDQGIAGHVAATGKILNIKDAYDHPLFYKGVDQQTGFKTRNILCFPIRDEQGIVGVAQLCNKLSGEFDFFDEEMAMAFSVLCGLSIMHSLVYKKIQDAQARTKLSNELMMYHMKVNTGDIAAVIECPLRHTFADFNSFDFSPRRISYRETICQVLKMFDDLKFMEKFRIKRDVLVRFLLYVQKGYRDTPYHNWYHAFSVAHFAYSAIKNFDLIGQGYITQLEAMAYIVSAICHDLDHRGTNNSFQMQTDTILANLYSSEGSVMERHHLAQTICTLNTEHCNFLEGLNNKDYVYCLDVIKDLILATDLATHFRISSSQYQMALEGYNKNSGEHRYLLLSLMMSCADLSDQTKDWSNSKTVARNIYDEFFKQGDMEKSMGNSPSEMMDRERASIPDLQIEFLQGVCVPLFKILSILFPSSRQLLENVKMNVKCWKASKAAYEDTYKAEGKSFFEVLEEPKLEEIVNELLKQSN